MRKIFLAVILLGAFTIFGCNKNAGADDSKNEDTTPAALQEQNQLSSDNNTSSKAFNFTLTDTQGKKINLSDYAGKIVIVDFWATWCPPCRRGIPDLISLQKQFKNKIAVIGISVDSDTKSDVIPFIKSMGINYTVCYASQEVVHAYGDIEAIPTSFVIDKDGNIVNQHVGLTDKSVYVDEINKLLGKS